MKLTDWHYGELIKAALHDRLGWVPLGPMETARRRQLGGPYSRPNRLADLEREGLILLTPGKSGETMTIRLTEAGRQAVLAMPDDLQVDWFPLPNDIAAAKAKLSAKVGHDHE